MYFFHAFYLPVFSAFVIFSILLRFLYILPQYRL
nr:MAG TPA: hypothetical protein [Caudoviricetes sp.]